MPRSLVLAIALFAAAIVPASAGEEPRYSYTGETGPAHWGELSEDWKTCGDGRRQSPIDLDGATASKLAPLGFGYQASKIEATDTGHTINFAPESANVLRLGGRPLGTLLQLHFHARSEHHLGNRSYPMEFHFVHADSKHRLTVVGVFVVSGAANSAAAALLRDLPEAEGETGTATLDPRKLLPSSHRSIRYSGSLTTPPCSERVRWIVLTRPITFSATQIARFRERYAHNNRPLQPLAGRTLRIGG